MPLTLVNRFQSQARTQQQTAIDAGQLRKLDELALLEAEHLRPLALASLLMFAAGGIFFGVLNFVAYLWQGQVPSLSFGGIILLLGVNVLLYCIILPIHEIIHALAFIFWGGKPYFGTKLPLALFCGAKNQLFQRNHYLVIGLAPLIVISIAAIMLILLTPALAVYTWLASAGNFAGAVGDVFVVARLLRLPSNVLVEDSETGYRAWEVPSV